MKVGIVGLGLIGASLALALRRTRPQWQIVGSDRDETTVAAAERAHVIDAAATFDQLGACDVIVLAIPVRQVEAVFHRLAPCLQTQTVITDAGSTKSNVIAAARTTLGGHIARFVPGHPIAGREKSGLAARDASLFENKNVVLTPLLENVADDIETVKALWRAAGAHVITMNCDEHDAVFAAVSHLPHVMAFALVEELAARPNARQLFSHAASGFRDFTRIASSSPDMWRDIALDNRAALVAEMDRMMARLQTLRVAIANGDGIQMEQHFRTARTARDKWLAGELDHFRDAAA